MTAAALSDHGNVGAAVEMSQALRAEGVKPILGVEAYLCKGDPALKGPENTRPYSHLVVLAKNLRGWKQVIKAVSKSNKKEHFYYHPRLSLECFREFAAGGDLIAISGHPGSDLGNCIFKDPKAAYNCGSFEDVTSETHVHADSKKRLIALAEHYLSVFGRGNFFLEVQVLDPVRMPACRAIATAMRWLSGRLGISCVATADSHYVERQDAYDQRVLLCSKVRTTINQVQRKIENEEDIELAGFFKGDCFHIPSYEEMSEHHTREELAMTLEVAAMCEDYEITSQPRMPTFPCPDGMAPRGYLRELVEAGWRRLIDGRVPDRELGVYRDRLEMELGVFAEANLESYFLIVQDLTNYGRSRGWLLGPGRGSAAGCLASYLLGITSIDPIPYGLLFERFYNAGRNAPGRVSLPDIDMDFPAIKRDEVFRYTQTKYGVDKVAKIATFQSLQGRSALDEVLSANEVDFELRKQMTKAVPDKAKITEELQEMKERGEEPSIIRYALDVFADDLAEWCRMGDDGTLSGDYAARFAQAMRLEGTKKNISTHAAGVIISDTPLEEWCPLKWDDAAGCWVAAMEYPALEAMGGMKLDLLSIAMLNKGEGVAELALTGDISDVKE